MSKKSQITVFIVVVLLLILGLMIILYLSGDYTPDSDIKTNLNIDAEATALTSYIKNCIDTSTKEVLITFGKQGGEIDITSPLLKLNVDNVSNELPFLYYKGNVSLVFLKEWESRLSGGIELSLEDCLSNKEVQKYEIESTEPIVNVTAEGHITNVIVEWPIDLYTIGSKADLQDTYSFKYSINLIHIFDDVLAVLSHTYLAPDKIDALYLTSLNTSLYYSIYEDVIIYTIFDPTSYLDERPYQFSFAVKLNESWVPTNETA